MYVYGGIIAFPSFQGNIIQSVIFYPMRAYFVIAMIFNFQRDTVLLYSRSKSMIKQSIDANIIYRTRLNKVFFFSSNP